MIKIGLLGDIGSGKSFIAKKLSASIDNQIDNIANVLEERAQWQKFGL